MTEAARPPARKAGRRRPGTKQQATGTGPLSLSVATSCAYYDDGRCRSCALLDVPYADQLERKQNWASMLLDDFAGPAGPGIDWLDPVASPPADFRTKAKLVVGGTVDAPTLGILGAEQHGVDLRGCPIVAPAIREALPALAQFITAARLAPYDVPARRGELKHLIVTSSARGELMVRFVLRSTESLARIRKHLPGLQERLPQLTAASVNLLPGHKAVLEGEEEIELTAQAALELPLGDVTLRLLPRSFVQTNEGIAVQLYRQGAAWAEELRPGTVWDLYCGVGGFALHLAAPGRLVTGVELSEEAVASAAAAAEASGTRARFVAADAIEWAQQQDAAPELVVVNPPRRGLGPELAGWLEGSGVRQVLYSSCNAESLARDLESMPSLRPVRAQLFDMFPHTRHFETLVLLLRNPAAAIR